MPEPVLTDAQADAFTDAFKSRQTICRAQSNESDCRSQGNPHMCHWSEDRKDCVAGSVKMCEPFAEASCAMNTDCRWYSNDGLCVTPQVHDVLTKNFQKASSETNNK